MAALKGALALSRSMSRTLTHSSQFTRALSSPAGEAVADDTRKESNHLNSTVTVNDVLQGRGDEILSTKKDALVFDAVSLMVKHNIGCCLVTDSNGDAVNIVSERDYLEKVIVKGKSSKTARVREIMSEKELVYVTRDATLTECMELMTNQRVRHIPVLDGKKAVGMVSIGDVVSALTDSYKNHEQLLKQYISAGY